MEDETTQLHGIYQVTVKDHPITTQIIPCSQPVQDDTDLVLGQIGITGHLRSAVILDNTENNAWRVLIAIRTTPNQRGARLHYGTVICMIPSSIETWGELKDYLASL